MPYRADRHRGGLRRAPLLDAAQDLHRPRAVQAVEHQVNDSGPAMAARARPGVAVLVEEPFDERPRRWGDVRPSVHHLRDRRQRHAGLGSDGRQGRPPWFSGTNSVSRGGSPAPSGGRGGWQRSPTRGDPVPPAEAAGRRFAPRKHRTTLLTIRLWPDRQVRTVNRQHPFQQTRTRKRFRSYYRNPGSRLRRELGGDRRAMS